jgi:SAM-dependent methyltransferase
MDSTLRFSTRVENYIKYRPRYPREVIETLQRECGLSSAAVIADIGSGTGVLTELFLQNENPVFAVEPNKEMREGAERLLGKYPGFRSIAGRAEATTLADRSVDFVVVGTAFHWFDPGAARDEFSRILRPPHWVMLIWNERDLQATPFLKAYERLLKKYSIDYAREKHRSVYSTSLADFYGAAGFTTRTFRYLQKLDYEGLKGRLQSSSYTPEPDHPNYEPMMMELREIFQSNESGGRVTFEYTTRMYYGRLTG